MSFGWCTAFEQFVKLYHPAGEFWSQCQFKIIARTAEEQGSSLPEVELEAKGLPEPQKQRPPYSAKLPPSLPIPSS